MVTKEIDLNSKLPINKGSTDNNGWIKKELECCKFKDARLGKRFQKLFERLWVGVGESTPFTCQAWRLSCESIRPTTRNRCYVARVNTIN